MGEERLVIAPTTKWPQVEYARLQPEHGSDFRRTTFCNSGGRLLIVLFRFAWKKTELFILRLLDHCRMVLATNCP
jgi:hypothetical protein